MNPKKPIVIAELSGNHNKSIKNAMQLVKKAALAKVDFIKLQTYTPDTMTINSNKKDFIIKNKKSVWNNQNLYSLYKKGYTPWNWHKEIFDYAKSLGINYLSTPFDETAVDFLEKLNVPMYKIASFENNNFLLIKKVIETKKPIIISVGMLSFKDIKNLVEFLKKQKCKNFTLLKCVSNYPAKPEESNVLTIPDMKKRFKCNIGLSDHTLGIGTSIAAVSHGATIIEKHFCLSRKRGGIDSSFSLEPNELSLLVKETKNAWLSLGKINYLLSKEEKKYKKLKRSIYFNNNLKKGHIITKNNIKIVRPGFGLEPKFFNKLIGKKLNKNVTKGTATKWSFFLK